MSRADRRSARSARAHASSRKRDSDLVALEDTMFFTRLRRHAKWMFVFLALVFAVGFVGFGIGANQNASLGDLIRGNSGSTSGNVSVSDAREQVQKNPKSAAGQARPRDRAAGGRQDRRGDHGAEQLRHAAPEGRGRAPRARRPLPRARQRARPGRSGRTVARELSHLRLDVRRPARPRQRRHDRHRPDRQRDLDAGLAAGQRRRTGRRRRPTRARRPRTRSWWRSPHAIRTSSWSSRRPRSRAGTRPRRSPAYQRFLTLAPDDPSAPIVKQQIAQLKAAQTPATSG